METPPFTPRTLLAGWWLAIRYYVREPPNVHRGGHSATILTVLRTPGGTVLDLSIAQPPEVALLGASRVADSQTLTNTLCAAYLPNKAVSGRAPEDEEDAGLILLLEERPARDGGALLPRP